MQRLDGDEATRDRLAQIGQAAAEIAHELRNILQIISATAFVANQDLGRGDAAAASAHLRKIEKNARAAHAMVDDLTALARGEPLRTEWLAISEVLAAAREDWSDGCALWEDAVEPPQLRVHAHAGLLVRLLHALYENAIQASAPRAPRVETRAALDDGRVVLEVSDDGPGVTAPLCDRVFEPLVSGRAGGTGFGLSLARRIVEAHGGTIRLEHGRGPGATFRIELPDRPR